MCKTIAHFYRPPSGPAGLAHKATVKANIHHKKREMYVLYSTPYEVLKKYII